MRHLLIQVPAGEGSRVLRCAERHGGSHLLQIRGEGRDGPRDLVLLDVPNPEVGPLLDELEPIEDLRVSFFPQGVLALRPPAEEAADQVLDVGSRSALEVYLSGLQSVGSWGGFLGYAAVAAVVVWVGLYTGTTFLLVAAMLIAPFAGPAMNAALAAARGDRTLLGRSALRYFAALGLAAAVSALLSLVLGLEEATPEMVERSQVASQSVLLPLAAGVAGALHLMQSERSSLVSGAAVGLLVAASLAPPTGVLGMAAALGRWDLAGTAAFLLVLQLVGIQFSGSLAFRCFGLTSEGSRYSRGRRSVAWGAILAAGVLLLMLLSFQFSGRPQFQRPSLAQRAAVGLQEAVRDSRLGEPVEWDVRYTRPSGRGALLLAEVYVRRASGVGLSDDEIADRLRAGIRGRLHERGVQAEVLVHVQVLSGER